MTGKISHQLETNSSKELDNNNNNNKNNTKRFIQRVDVLSSPTSFLSQTPTDYGSLISTNQEHLTPSHSFIGVHFRNNQHQHQHQSVESSANWWKDKRPRLIRSQQSWKEVLLVNNSLFGETSEKSSQFRMKNIQVNIRTLGVAFFVFASIFCLYQLWLLKDEKPVSKYPNKRLLMVNILNRHGDRSPSDDFPKGDRHAEKIEYFWPNGLFNLTAAGRSRQFRIGLETRRRYANFIDFNSSQVLAFSSPVGRCQESLALILQGIYDLEWTRAEGFAQTSNCSSSSISSGTSPPTPPSATDCPFISSSGGGSGSPDEWKKVAINTTGVPSLIYDYLNECAFRKKHPSPLDTNLLEGPDIKVLPGVNRLKEIIKNRYDLDFNFTCLGLWSTIATEINLVHTKETFPYTSHYRDWIGEPVLSQRSSSSSKKHHGLSRYQHSSSGNKVIPMFDLYEQVTVLAYRDRVVDEARYVQIGPIITSIIDSQLIALGRNVTHPRQERYKNKKMILYSSHDSILQLILNSLGLINYESTFEERYDRYHNSNDDLSKFLNGLTMSSYGMSTRLELYQLEDTKSSNRTYPFVQASIYNKEDGKYQPIEYKTVNLGSACQRVFKKRYPKASSSELWRFYDPYWQIDTKIACPFNLFLNITANFVIDDNRIRDLCGY